MSQKNQIRIGIDARFFGPRQKGLGRYVQKLVEGLEQIDKYNQYIIFLRKDNWDKFQPKNPNFKKVLADYRWYSLKEQIFLPFRIWQQKIDLMHFPHFNFPVLYFGPFIVTIHDLVLKKFPTRRASSLGPFRYFIKNLAYQAVIRLAVKRAKKIIAVSNYTKQDILRHFNIRPDKIKVIYEGGPNLKLSKTKIQDTNRLNITKPYLLYVGNAYPHKNLERLIIAFSKLAGDKKYCDLQLVLVGEMDYFYQRLKNLSYFSLAEMRQKIIFAGFVPDQDLGILYHNALLYVFPSLCEGFGLPPLEAMTYGCPVVCSNTTCLPEILGPAALYFDPENIDQIVLKIKQAIEDNHLREKLISQGFKRVKNYQWSKMAEQTLGIYKL